MAGTEILFELEYYSVGGGFIEWKGYVIPEKGQPKYPYQHAKELQKYLIDDQVPLGRLLLENEMAILRQGREGDMGVPRSGCRSNDPWC